MSQIELDMLYGVRTLNGVRVVQSNLARQTVYRVKKWKRLNRPDKTKTKAVYTPTAYMVGGVVYAHQRIIERLKSSKRKQLPEKAQ